MSTRSPSLSHLVGRSANSSLTRDSDGGTGGGGGGSCGGTEDELEGVLPAGSDTVLPRTSVLPPPPDLKALVRISSRTAFFIMALGSWTTLVDFGTTFSTICKVWGRKGAEQVRFYGN